MNEELFGKLLEAEFMTFDIKTLSKEEIMDKDVFDRLLVIEDEIEREKMIMQLEERAKEVNCLPNFKNILKGYRKKFSIENKQCQKKEQLKHNEVAEMLLEENSIAIYKNDLYIYIDGVYELDKKYIERKIIEKVPEANSYFRSEVYKYLELKDNICMSLDKESGVINFKNGLFNIKEKKLYNHTPEFFSINQININFNENAKVIQAVEDFLDKISSYKKKRKQALLEMIGYCMTTSVKLQKAFILYGETARNGKSTLIMIITKLIGRDNSGNVSFYDINNNRFAVIGIKGKILNTGAEMTEEYIKDISIWKMIITGDDIEVEEKHKPREIISPYAKLIFNANTLPRVSDKTNAFYRRLHIIPLEKSFTAEESRNFDINELLTQEALEYLAKISLEAYTCMNGEFSNYEESEREVNKYKVDSNSVLAFVNDKENLRNLYNDGEEVYKAISVYRCYKDYCRNNQLKEIGQNKFYNEIEKSGAVIEVKVNNQKAYIFRDIKAP